MANGIGKDRISMVVKVVKVGQYSYEVLGTDGEFYTTSTKDVDSQVDCFSRFDKK